MLKKYEQLYSSLVHNVPEVQTDDQMSYDERPVQMIDHQDMQLRIKIIPLVKILWHLHGVE